MNNKLNIHIVYKKTKIWLCAINTNLSLNVHYRLSGANIHSACFISCTCIMHLKLHEVQRLNLALIHNRFSISVSDKLCWIWIRDLFVFLPRKDYETFPYLYDFLQLPPTYATSFTLWNYAFYIKMILLMISTFL